MYEDRGAQSWGWMPSTRSGIDNLISTEISSLRTTKVDVMTTLNTASHVKGSKPEALVTKAQALATLPQRFEEVSLRAEMSPGRGGKTRFEKLKGLDSHYYRCQSLLEERNEYFLALYAEKQAKEDMQHYCATRIQAMYRGFNARPRMGYSWGPPRSPGLKFRTWKFAPNEIADELCKLSSRINLPIIPGLTLEPRGKASKRQRNIRIAAHRRLVLFMRMIVAKFKARRYIAQVRQNLHNKMARRIVRLFRMIMAKSFTSKALAVKRGNCATVINNAARRFLSRKRVRLIKRYAVHYRRANTGAIIITRNFKNHHKKKMMKTAARRDSLAQEAVSLVVERIFIGAVHTSRQPSRSSSKNSLLDEMLSILSQELLVEEICNKAVTAGLEYTADALIASAAQTAGELQLAEQMAELERLRLRLEQERLQLEAEQRRLQMEEHRARETAERKAAEELARALAAQEAEAKAAAEANVLALADSEVDRSAILELDTSVRFAEDSYMEPELSPLGFTAKTMGMPCSVTKLRGSRADYDIHLFFPPSVVSYLESASMLSAFVSDGEYRYDDLQLQLEQARENYDGGSYASAYKLYMSVLQWLLRRMLRGNDTITVLCEDLGDNTSALMTALRDTMALQSNNVSATAAVGLLAQLSIFVGDCLHELCMYPAAQYKYELAKQLRLLVSCSERNAGIAEVKVKLGKALLSQAQFSAADVLYREAIDTLIPLQTELQNALQPALTPMSRAALTNFSLEDSRDDGTYTIDGSGGYGLGAYDPLGHLHAHNENNTGGILGTDEHTVSLDTVQYTLVQAYSNQARLLRYSGQYEAALHKTQDALRACEALFNTRNERNELLVADIVSTRAALYKIAGLRRRAYDLYSEARDIYTETVGAEHPLTATSHVRLAYAAAVLGLYPVALSLVDAAVVVQRSLDKSASSPPPLFFGCSGAIAVAQSLHCKGWIYLQLARYEEARPLLDGSYQLREQVFPLSTGHPTLAHAKATIADLACACGSYRDALPQYDVAISMMQSSFLDTPENVNIAHIKRSKATCWAHCGLTVEALALYEDVKMTYKKALMLRRKLVAGLIEGNLSESFLLDASTDGAVRTEVADNASEGDESGTSFDIQATNIGICRQLLNLGQLPEAKGLSADIFARILALYDEELGGVTHKIQSSDPSEVLYGDCLQLQGEVAMALGRFQEADEVFDRACGIKKRVLGDGHPDVAAVLLLMTRNLLGPGYVEEALLCCRRAAELLSVKFDKKSAPAAACLYATAQAMYCSGKYSRAQELYQHAMFVAAQFFTENSSHYAVIQSSLGDCYRMQKRSDLAMKALQQSANVLNTLCGGEHPLTLRALRSLALAQLDSGLPEEARILLEDHVLPSFERAAGIANTPDIVYTRGLVGICFSAEYELLSSSDRLIPDADLESARNLIDDALEYFDTYPQGPFDNHHPWIKDLGGFVTQSRVGTARSGAGSSRSSSRISARQYNYEGDYSHDAMRTSHEPIANVLDYLLLTEAEKNAPISARSCDIAKETPQHLLLSFTEPERVNTAASGSRFVIPIEGDAEYGIANISS